MQEKNRNRDFQDCHYGGHLRFLIGTNLAIFDLRVNRVLLSFKSTGLSVQENRRKIDFSNWLPRRPSLVSVRKDLATFDLQVTAMFPTKFQVNLLFGSGEEAKNRFTKWPLWRPSWI